MKKISVILLMVPFMATAQISENSETSRVTIGEVKFGPSVQSRLYYTVNDDTTYYLMFMNAKYQTIKDYKFVSFGGSETVGTLYDILKSAFRLSGDQTKEITLGETPVMIGSVSKGISITAKGGFFFLTEKNLDKLFGK